MPRLDGDDDALRVDLQRYAVDRAVLVRGDAVIVDGLAQVSE